MSFSDKLIEYRNEVAFAAGLAASPIAFETITDSIIYGVHSPSHAMWCAAKTVFPYVVYLGVRAAAIFYMGFFSETAQRKRTKSCDFKRIKFMEKTLRESDRPNFHLSAESSVKGFAVKSELSDVEHNFGKGEYDSAIARLVELIGKGRLSKLAFLKSQILARKLAAKIGRVVYARDMQTYMLSAAYGSFFDPVEGWYFSSLGRMVADEFDTPYRKEMYVFHALLSSAQRRSDEVDAWEDALKVMREEPVWERLGETRTLVRRLQNSDFFASTFVFKERESLDALVEEAELSSGLQGACPGLEVPEPLFVSREEFEGRYCLVSKYLSGDLLYDRLHGKDFSDVGRVAVALADIHACFEPEVLTDSDLKGKIVKKFDDLGSCYLAESFLSGLTPIVESFQDVPWFWNKDAHPENWIVGDRIGVLDCEGRVRAPCVFDLANLLEYDDFLADSDIIGAVELYSDRLKEHGFSVEGRALNRAYLNAVIYRMVCLAGAWSDPSRPSRAGLRVGALERARSAVVRLKGSDPEYFESYSSDYLKVDSVLSELISNVSYVS